MLCIPPMFHGRNLILLAAVMIFLKVLEPATAAYPKQRFFTPFGAKVVGTTLSLCAATVISLSWNTTYNWIQRSSSQYLPAEKAQILFEQGEEEFPSTVQFNSLALTNSAQVLRIMPRALIKYPPYFLEGLVDKFYFGQNIKVDNAVVGGAAPDKVNYVIVAAVPSDDLWTEYVIHHEIAHQIFERYFDQFPHDKWNALLPKNFKYFGSGVALIKSGLMNQPDAYKNLHQDGFYDRYAKGSLHEDIAVTLGWMMMRSPQFKEAAEKNPTLKAKVELLREFLYRLHPEFLHLIN